MSTLSTYPARDLDTPALLASVLGTFWTNVYADQPELMAELAALAIPWRQAARDNDAMIASLADSTFPVLQVNEWYAVTIKASDQSNPALVGLRYEPTTAVTFGSGRRFGDVTQTSLFPIALSGIYDAPMILDSLYLPQVCLTRDVDYTVDTENGILWLAVNPFTNPSWQPIPVYDAFGNQIDQQLTLWFWHAGLDENLLYQRLGYAFGITPPPTIQGRQLLSTILSSLVQGTTLALYLQFLSLIYDIPICATDGETVVAIFTDTRGLCIVTDQTVYRAAAGSVPVVAVGDTLLAGDSLTDGLSCTRLVQGVIPPGVTSLILGDGILPSWFPGGVAWLNQTVPVVATIQDGQVRTSWSLGVGGWVERKFWDQVHARGLAAGVLLANYLDVRPNPTTPVAPMNLPADINPMQFLLANVLRGGVLLVQLQASRIGSQAMSSSFLNWTRKLVPPVTLLLFQAALVPIDDGFLPTNTNEAIGWLPAAPWVLSDGYSPTTGDIITIKAINYAGD